MTSAEEALRCFDPLTALELFDQADPADPTAQCGRVRAHWALRRAEEARAALEALPQAVRELAAGRVAEGTIGLGRRPSSKDVDASLADAQNLATVLADLLPPDCPMGLRARLYESHRRQRAILKNDAKLLENVCVVVGVVLILTALVMSYWALGKLGASRNPLPAIALLIAEFGAIQLYPRAISKVASPMRPNVGTSLVGAVGLPAVVLRGHGHPSTLLLFPFLILAFITLFSAVIGAAFLVIDLLVLLEHEPALIRPAVRRECLAVLERIALGQEDALMAPVNSGRGAVEKPTEYAFRQHVAAVVAATRDLKRDVLSPGPDTWANLRARLREDLAATCHGRWNLLPYRTPDPAGKVLRIRLLSALRSLLVLLIPPGLLYLLSVTHVLPAAVPQQILLIAYLGWPALVVLLWLDPRLADKVNLVKAAGDAVNVFKPNTPGK